MPDVKLVLHDTELEDYIDAHFTKSLFRLESLDYYAEGGNEDLLNYCSGTGEPNLERKESWLKQIRQEVEEGRFTERVHVVRSPLNDYLRYECEWGYVYNSKAGEEIRILDLEEVSEPEGLLIEDFWLIDNQHAVVMHYDGNGSFTKAEVVQDSELERYRAARDAAWNGAVPFEKYWDLHPQYWRINQHAK